jgi:hypothetical protein
MSFDQLYEPQSPRVQRAAGYLAFAAGLFAIAFALWLPFHEAGRTPQSATFGIVGIAGVVGLYALVLARRLLSHHAPRYLVSPVTLMALGLLFAAAGAMLLFFVPKSARGGLEQIGLGLAAAALGWKRHRSDARSPMTRGDAT